MKKTIAIIILFLVIGAGTILIANRSIKHRDQINMLNNQIDNTLLNLPNPNQIDAKTTEPQKSVPTGWKTFTGKNNTLTLSGQFNLYSFRYPNGFSVVDQPAGSSFHYVVYNENRVAVLSVEAKPMGCEGGEESCKSFNDFMKTLVYINSKSNTWGFYVQPLAISDQDKKFVDQIIASFNLEVNVGWKVSSDAVDRLTFQYPEKLDYKYIFTQSWPPEISIDNRPFVCELPEGSTSTTSASSVEISGKPYCIITTTEGAAGSIYKTYSYKTAFNNKMIVFHFVLQYPQCGNYPDPQMTECNTEQANFNLDNLIDQIAQSVR